MGLARGSFDAAVALVQTATHTATHCNTLQHTQLHQMVGLARGAFDAALAHAHERKQFGTAVADFQALYIACPESVCVVVCCSCSVLLLRTSRACNFNDCSTHCNTLQHTHSQGMQFQYACAAGNIATHCNTLQHTATHCNTLQHTATHVILPLILLLWTCSACHLNDCNTHCNTLQHTLQHTATHCNTLQHTLSYLWYCCCGLAGHAI